MVCLDLTEMDDILIPYSANFSQAFSDIQKVVFVHNIRFDYPEQGDMIRDELDAPLATIVDEMLSEKIDSRFRLLNPEVETEVIITEDDTTAHGLVEVLDEVSADLVILGKKINYQGSGLVSEMLFRVPGFRSSMLLVPETAYYHIRDILVAIDFSKGSGVALALGSYLEKQVESTLSCLHIYDIPNHYFPYIPLDGLQDRMKENVKKEWDKYKKKLDPSLRDLPCAFVFSNSNSVAQAIYNYAIREKKDLIIVNSKGRGELTAYLIGSVALRLVNMDTHIPVWVTHGA
jgi:nucleotide-binding universal stress UspA family protein